ncbi:MAG: energy-coupling factor transporter transmembrane component T [Anaerolineaceae bacterium]|jgi:energy-coupling factor transport system permease protein
MLASFNYRNRHSPVDRLDPRARWVFSFLALFTIISFWDIRFLLFFLALGFGQFLLARLTWRETRRAWLMVFFLSTVMISVNTIITGAGTIAQVGETITPVVQWSIALPFFGWQIDWTLTAERIWFGLTQYTRLFSIASLFIVIPYTMNPSAYGAVFRRLGLGDRIAFALDLSFRFVPTIARDFNITLDAQRARGYEIENTKGGLFAMIARVAPLIVPVTMNALLTGEDIANAMDLRCFGLQKRTWIMTFQYHKYDYALIGFGILLLVGSLVLRHAFGIGDFWVPAWLIS